MVDKMWDFFEHITQSWEVPLNRDNKDTWKEIYKLYPSHSMLMQYWGSQLFNWFIIKPIQEQLKLI
jgi:hypothetical protein